MNTDWLDPRKAVDPDATAIVDRGGARVRFYRRKDATRPGAQERRRQAAAGLAWCRDCRAWLPIAKVRQGCCREHLAADQRRRYASDPKFRAMRKRNAKLQKRKRLSTPNEVTR